VLKTRYWLNQGGSIEANDFFSLPPIYIEIGKRNIMRSFMISTKYRIQKRRDLFLFAQRTSKNKYCCLAIVSLLMNGYVKEKEIALTLSALRASINIFLREGESLSQFASIPVPDGVAYLTTQPMFVVDDSVDIRSE